MSTVARFPAFYKRFLGPYVPWFPLCVSLAGSTIVSFFPGPISVLSIVISVLVAFGWFFVRIVQIGAAAWRRQWRHGAKLLIMVTAGLPLTVVGGQAGDYMHLAILYPVYRVEIAQTTERPVSFGWGDRAVMMTDGLDDRTLQYDDTGTIARTLPGLDEGVCLSYRRLVGSFFIEEASSEQTSSGCGPDKAP